MDLLIIHIEDQARKLYNVNFKFRKPIDNKTNDKSHLYKSMHKITPELE